MAGFIPEEDINVGIQGKVWEYLSNLYDGAASSVIWQGLVSPPFEIKQGVCQGGILSTLHYKLFNDELLHLQEFLKVGMSIGHIDCNCPTCADDITLLANFFLCLQLLLVVAKFSFTMKITIIIIIIIATKSAEVDLNRGTKDHFEQQRPALGEGRIEMSDSEVHLGVDRNHAGTVHIKASV